MCADFGSTAKTLPILCSRSRQTHHSWGTSLGRLADAGWYGLAFDARGHGVSSWAPNGDYTLGRFAADIVALVDWLGRPPVLVGASLGGVSSLAALANRPQLAAALVLVDVSPFVQAEGAARVRKFMQADPGGFSSLDEVADAIARYVPHRPRPRSLEGLHKNLRRIDDRWYWHWDPRLLASPEDEMVQRNLVLDPVWLARAAAYLRIPTLLVRGGMSDIVLQADARRFLEMVPHAEYFEVPEAGHMVAGDDNSVFDQSVLDFLDRRVRPRVLLGADDRLF